MFSYSSISNAHWTNEEANITVNALLEGWFVPLGRKKNLNILCRTASLRKVWLSWASHMHSASHTDHSVYSFAVFVFRIKKFIFYYSIWALSQWSPCTLLNWLLIFSESAFQGHFPSSANLLLQNWPRKFQMVFLNHIVVSLVSYNLSNILLDILRLFYLYTVGYFV